MATVMWIYIASSRETSSRSGMAHTVLLANNTMPALPCKCSPDGATTVTDI